MALPPLPPAVNSTVSLVEDGITTSICGASGVVDGIPLSEFEASLIPAVLVARNLTL